MNAQSKILVLGHRGLVGSAVVRELQRREFLNTQTTPRSIDLTNAEQTRAAIAALQPEYVVICAAKCGGIERNINNGDMLMRANLLIQESVLSSCACSDSIKRVIFLGSSCVYPSNYTRPWREDDLNSGPLESTNLPYALSKLAGIETCLGLNWNDITLFGQSDRFIVAMPCNLYGPGDNSTHLIPDVMQKLSRVRASRESGDTRQVVRLLGDGSPFRELLHVDDLAKALILLLETAELAHEIYNIGYGSDHQVRDIVQIIQRAMDAGHIPIEWSGQTNGVHRKLIDSSRIRLLGWEPRIPLECGINRLVNGFTTPAMAWGMGAPDPLSYRNANANIS